MRSTTAGEASFSITISSPAHAGQQSGEVARGIGFRDVDPGHAQDDAPLI